MAKQIKRQVKIRTGAGFTLIELIVTMAILAILVSLALPSFAAFINQSRTYSTALDMKSALVTASAEAIKRGGLVKLCASQDGEQCSGSIGDGWIVYHDTDEDDQVDDDEEVLLVNNSADPLTIVTALAEGAAINSFAFNYRGFANSSADITVARSDSSRVLTLSRSGRVELN